MTKKRILVVEDDPSVAEVLHYNLQQAGYAVVIATDGREGLRLADATPPELVLLDIMLPELDGIEVCRRLRANSRTCGVLVVMLTAKSEEVDQLVGFGVGADDYVTKPFSVKVLLERIKALLRRQEGELGDRDVIITQGILIDRSSYQAQAGDHRLDLTKSEFSLLEVLARNPGRAFTRAELIDAALGPDTIVLERTIDVHVRSLRRKLGSYAALIETVRGVGYRFHDPRTDLVEM